MLPGCTVVLVQIIVHFVHLRVLDVLYAIRSCCSSCLKIDAPGTGVWMRERYGKMSWDMPGGAASYV